MLITLLSIIHVCTTFQFFRYYSRCKAITVGGTATLRQNARYTRIRHFVCDGWSSSVKGADEGADVYHNAKESRETLTPSLCKNGKKPYDSTWYSDIL